MRHSPPHLRLEYAADWPLEEWRQQWRAGQRADEWPYDLGALAQQGFEVTVARGTHSPLRLRRMTGGVDVVGAWRRPGPPGCVTLCWDEQTGAAAALRSTVTRERVVTGAIWLTDGNTLPMPARRAYAAGLRRAKRVFVLSPLQVEPLVTRWGVERERVVVVAFGINSEFWRVEEPPPAQPHLLSVGSDRHRDYGVLAEAVRLLRVQHPGLRCDVAVGRPVPWPSDLGDVHVGLSHRSLRARYAAASAVVLTTQPNLHGSGMTAALEAMACGRPVVVSDTGGMAGYVQDGVGGRLCAVGDAAATAAATAEMLDVATAQRVGEAGRRHVLSRHTSRHLHASLAALVAEVGDSR